MRAFTGGSSEQLQQANFMTKVNKIFPRLLRADYRRLYSLGLLLFRDCSGMPDMIDSVANHSMDVHLC